MNFTQMVRVWWRLRRGKPVGLSIDITDRCTLSCAGCYMKWYEPREDLPLERWEKLVQSFPQSERWFCAWTGGEPLLRADAVRTLSRHFRWNWVATNGTLPIPEMPRTTAFVSVDGPREIHDRLRGGWGDIVRNVTPACYLACTVRRENCSPEALRELVEFWRGKARGIVFGFLTPRKGREGEALDRPGRESVVRTLRGLRRRVGGFIVGVGGELPDCARTAWGRDCPAAAALTALDSQGRRKRPCVLGSEVECALCGCAVPGFLRRVRRFHVGTLAETARLFRGRPARACARLE